MDYKKTIEVLSKGLTTIEELDKEIKELNMKVFPTATAYMVYKNNIEYKKRYVEALNTAIQALKSLQEAKDELPVKPCNHREDGECGCKYLESEYPCEIDANAYNHAIDEVTPIVAKWIMLKKRYQSRCGEFKKESMDYNRELKTLLSKITVEGIKEFLKYKIDIGVSIGGKKATPLSDETHTKLAQAIYNYLMDANLQ